MKLREYLEAFSKLDPEMEIILNQSSLETHDDYVEHGSFLGMKEFIPITIGYCNDIEEMFPEFVYQQSEKFSIKVLIT